MIQEHVVISPLEIERIKFDFTDDIVGDETIAGTDTILTCYDEESGEAVDDILSGEIDDAASPVLYQNVDLTLISDDMILIVKCLAQTSSTPVDHVYERSVRLIIRMDE